MNIALIRPPKISGTFEKIFIQEPINLAYLGAFLKSHGISVLIFDFEIEPFTEYNLAEKLKIHNIDAVGITAMTPTINNAHKVAIGLKALKKEIPVILGGPHASAIPEETLRQFPAFDYVVIGEGELPLLGLCKHIENKKSLLDIPGIGFRTDNKIIINTPAPYIENLDSLPFPDRTLLNQNGYKNIYAAGINKSNINSTFLFTTRGCSQKCTFCAVKNTNGPKVRFRSAENVIAELKDCRDKFGYQHITFEDTNLTLDRKRFEKIAHALKTLKLTWDCQTKVSLVDKELIKTMKDCGCLKIAYGVESGSEKILKLIKKNITLEQIKKAFRLTHEAKIVACGFFILGSHPEENYEDVRLTEKLIHEIRPDVFQLGIICPYPGTEIYSIMKNEGLINSIDWEKFNFMHANTPWGTKFLTPEQLTKLQKQIYLRYIFSPYFLGGFLKKLFDLREITHMIKLSMLMLSYLIFERRN